MIMRNIMKKQVLGVLVVVVVLVSGINMADNDVVAEADEMAKRIEEESKKVDAQTDAMVSEIDTKSKTLEDAKQEKRFEEASNHVDEIMDKSEKAVDDKDKIAEDLENKAENKVEELGRKIEENGNRNKKFTSDIRGLGKKMSIPGLIKHATVTYKVSLPSEKSVGEEIEEAMKEGEQMQKISEDLSKTHANKGEPIEESLDAKNRNDLNESFSGSQDFKSKSKETGDDTNQGKAVYSFSSQQDFRNSQENGNGETDDGSRQGEAVESSSLPQNSSNLQGNGNEESDDTKSYEPEAGLYDSQIFNNSTQDNENEETGNVMAARQRKPMVDSFSEPPDSGYELTGEPMAGDKESNKDIDEKDPNNDNKDVTLTENKRPLDEENNKYNDMKHEGPIIDVDLYQEDSDPPSMNKTNPKGKNSPGLGQDDKHSFNMQENSTSVVSQTPPIAYEHNTHTDHQKAPKKLLKTPDVESSKPIETNNANIMKPDQNVLNQIEEDYVIRTKQKDKGHFDQELSKIGATGLNKEFDTRWDQMRAANDPEMLLRWPSLGKVIGKIGADDQTVSMISPGEVDFLQTEYPSYMRNGPNENKAEVLVRELAGNKKRNVVKGSRKQDYLRKILAKN